MTEFKDTEHETRAFKIRLVVAMLFVLTCFILLLSRFTWLQIMRHDLYAARAEDNRISIVPIEPSRGRIIDRHGIVLAHNEAAYTLEITPVKLQEKIDHVINQLSEIIDISPKDRRQFLRLLGESNHFSHIPLRSHLSDEEVARFVVQRYRFPGVNVQVRFLRNYPLDEMAAHVLGYIGRINAKEEASLKEGGEASNYKGTTIIGKEGLEKSYEKILHGITGYEEIEVTATGRQVRHLSQVPAIPGKNLVLSLDIGLQKVAQAAFGNRRGALVAIEPATGDILAYVSQPSYNLNLFTNGINQQNWNALLNSPDYPLLNRPMVGTYPPGSTYKPFMALAALELNKRTPDETIHDPGYFILGNHRFRSPRAGGHGMVNMHKAIVESSDVYFYILASDLGVDAIHGFMKRLGLGQKTGIDLAYERTGILPSTTWKRQSFKNPTQQSWIMGDTISLGIGQGYNAFTPLQMAYATAILANDGMAMKPHLVNFIEEPGSPSQMPQRQFIAPQQGHSVSLHPGNLAIIKQAMVDVTKQGTAARIFHGASYISAGKTGTAQVFSIKQNEKYVKSNVSERMRDHAWYIAFAPVEKPAIAIAVIVENGGFGTSAAAPIVRTLFDYYLHDVKSSSSHQQKNESIAHDRHQ